jgi:hypothetical protein
MLVGIFGLPMFMGMLSNNSSRRSLLTMKNSKTWLWFSFLAGSVSGLSLSAGIANDPESVAEWAAGVFFEKQVQPILESACFDCHSHGAKSVKGGLYVDSRSGWELGGNSGQIVVPGDPDASLLIQAVRYQDEDLQMPPKDKRLSEEQVAILEKWVRFGALDPREVAVAEVSSVKHWAFQPVRQAPLPQVKTREWVQTPIDLFVLNKLEDQGMRPSPRAERSTLIRRAYFDLIGLPPTMDEVQRFESNRSPDAFGQLVDQLLASPQYGERWGRHWLDIARYADTKGYVFQEERRFPYSYTYRDYVINAFNQDLPYDQFIIEQLAADQMDRGDDPRALAGMGFLTLGRRFLNNQHDIIDDRIDVVTRGLMGLTVSCARCHDHKYDPIPTADYYSLYGVFASSQEPSERPLLEYDASSPLYRDYEVELARVTSEWNDYQVSNQEGALSVARQKTGDYLMALYDARESNRSETENLVKKRKLGPVIAFRWQRYLEGLDGKFDSVFAPWLEMAKLADPEKEIETLVIKMTSESDGTRQLNPALVSRLLETTPASASEMATVYGELFTLIEKEWQSRPKGAETLEDPNLESIRQLMDAEEAPTSIPLGQATQLLEVRVQEKIRSLKRKVDQLPATHAGAPARAMSLVDRKRTVEPVVFLRGKPGSRGPKVPRQFLSLIEGEIRQPFEHGSGRLELAQSIASADNPLTSRVIVNRLWRYHFGKALVDTPSDFGIRAQEPSHPELLDYLASRLIRDEWSIKRIHRLMMLSSTYQQASGPDAWHAAKDSENRFLWRMNRKRLELEPLRDTLLAVTGSLDTKIGGQPVEITEEPFAPRRTIYGFIERQNLPGLFRTFDLASPDSSSSGRFETTVPQQALFMVNSLFVQDLARNLEQEILGQPLDGLDKQVGSLFRKVLQRNPSHDEKQVAMAFLESQTDATSLGSLDEDWQYGYGKVDVEGGKAESFIPFSYFKKRAWQGGDKLPDEHLDWAMLNAKGGHPGSGENLAVIRRWTAPYASLFDIEGKLEHSPDQGNGVRAWVLSSRVGVLGSWDARNESRSMGFEQLNLAEGETLDFVVGALGDVSHDSFDWLVKLRTQQSPLLSDRRNWNSKEDFEGPQDPVKPLSALARLGQVLLMSNELVFVD